MVRGRIIHWAARTESRFKDCVVVCREGRTDLTFVSQILVMQVAQSRTSVIAFYIIGEPAIFPSRRVGMLNLSNKTIKTAGMLWKKLMHIAYTTWIGKVIGVCRFSFRVTSSDRTNTKNLVIKKTPTPSMKVPTSAGYVVIVLLRPKKALRIPG